MTGNEAVLASWRTQLRAMDEGDTATLETVFTPDAVLVHMTGFKQAVPDWLAGIRARRFVYHELIDKGVQNIRVTEEHAQLCGRIITGVTRDGTGQAWRLEIEQDYSLIDGSWLCTESRVTTW